MLHILINFFTFFCLIFFTDLAIGTILLLFHKQLTAILKLIPTSLVILKIDAHAKKGVVFILISINMQTYSGGKWGHYFKKIWYNYYQYNYFLAHAIQIFKIFNDCVQESFQPGNIARNGIFCILSDFERSRRIAESFCNKSWDFLSSGK